MTYSCADFVESITGAMPRHIQDQMLGDDLAPQADLVLGEIARLQSVIKFTTPTQITVWVFMQCIAGESADKATVTVFGSKAEADQHWRKHAEELWVCEYGGDTPVTEIPEGDQELCEDLEAKGCMDWGEVEAQTITVSATPLKAVVEVSGGVAEVTTCPAGVEVEIIDHDNLDDEEPQTDKT